MLSTLCLTWDDLDLLVTIPMKGCAIRRTRPLALIYCGNLAIILTASTQMTQKKTFAFSAERRPKIAREPKISCPPACIPVQAVAKGSP